MKYLCLVASQHLLVQALYILPLQHYLYPVISCHYQLYNYSFHSGQRVCLPQHILHVDRKVLILAEAMCVMDGHEARS